MGCGGAAPEQNRVSSGGRRPARERALELLYEAEQKSTDCASVISSLPVAPDAYATALAVGADERREEIDGLIVGHLASGWTIERLSAVDRAILRSAVCELLAHDDVPVAVVISEAVELAKEYSTDESARFVNGALSAIATECRSSS
jgi:N utilization substance protein B